MRRWILGLVAALLVAVPASAKNATSHLHSGTIATGAPVTLNIVNPQATTGYLRIITSNEAATASLAVVVNNTYLDVSGDGSIGAPDLSLGQGYPVCTGTAITTATTWVMLLGSTQSASEGIDQACDGPLADALSVTLTVTGTDASFHVDVLWTPLEAVGN